MNKELLKLVEYATHHDYRDKKKRNKKSVKKEVLDKGSMLCLYCTSKGYKNRKYHEACKTNINEIKKFEKALNEL